MDATQHHIIASILFKQAKTCAKTTSFFIHAIRRRIVWWYLTAWMPFQSVAIGSVLGHCIRRQELPIFEATKTFRHLSCVHDFTASLLNTTHQFPERFRITKSEIEYHWIRIMLFFESCCNNHFLWRWYHQRLTKRLDKHLFSLPN